MRGGIGTSENARNNARAIYAMHVALSSDMRMSPVEFAEREMCMFRQWSRSRRVVCLLRRLRLFRLMFET